MAEKVEVVQPHPPHVPLAQVTATEPAVVWALAQASEMGLEAGSGAVAATGWAMGRAMPGARSNVLL